MEEEPTLPAATDWRAEFKNATRLRIVRSICAKLKQQWSAHCPAGMNMDKITSNAIEHEKKCFYNSKSKEEYYNDLARKMSRCENCHESSSSHDRPAFSSAQSAMPIKNAEAFVSPLSPWMTNRHESLSCHDLPAFSSTQSVAPKQNAEAFVSQSTPQMSNQPYQLAVTNPQYQQPPVPNSLVQQHIQQLRPQYQQPPVPNSLVQQHIQQLRPQYQQPPVPNSLVQPHQQLHRQKLNVRQHQQFGNHMSPEMSTQHPRVVSYQPNENLTAQVKEGGIGEDFHASTFSNQHHTVIEQHKQHQSIGVSVVPNGDPNAKEDWLDGAVLQMQRLKIVSLPLLKKAFERKLEKCPQVGQTDHNFMKYKHQVEILQNMIGFLELPEEKITSFFTKERFFRFVRAIVIAHKSFENRLVQHSDNVKTHFHTVDWATTGSADSSIAPRELGSLRSEADWKLKNLSQTNGQHSENIEGEFQSPGIQQMQKSTEYIQAVNKSGMSLKHHLNSKFSPQIHEASQLSQISERALLKNPCASLYGRAASTPPPSSIVGLGKNSSLYGRASCTPPPSSIVGLGKDSSNAPHLSSSNFQYPQGWNSLLLLHSKAEIQVQSHNIRSSSTMTSWLAEPPSLGSNGQLSTETQASNRLLKAVESMSNEALRVAVSQISSVGNVESTTTEACLSGAWCHKKATHLNLEDGCSSSNNLKRKINAITINDIPSPCSEIDGSEPTVTSRSKKLKKLSNDGLLEELRNINKHFVGTILEFDLEENVNRRFANAGTVLRCSYNPASESKNSVLHSANAPKLSVLFVKLLVPLDYPEDYPVFLSRFDTDCGTENEEFRDMSREATSMLRAFLRTAPDCLSLEGYARAWDKCARAVVAEHAQRAGGGCFSSQYLTWEEFVADT